MASCFGLAGFAIAVVAGLAVGNASGHILSIALVSMILCHIAGLGAGLIGESIVKQYMEQYRAARPLTGPGTSSPSDAAGAPARSP